MSLPPLPYHTINAFAPTPHAGNQAAVVIVPPNDPRANDAKWMQTIASDFNLSETAFLVSMEESGSPKYGLRWFTPGEEVPLCGHATLAAAYTLFNYVHPTATSLRFQTMWRGELGATMEGERGQGSQVGLNLPVAESKVPPEDWKCAAAAAAGLPKSDIIGLSEFDFGKPAAIVQIKEDVDLKNLKVAADKLMPTFQTTVVYTQLVPKDSTADVIAINARVYAPGVGIDEDPVTGSAWAAMAGYYLFGPGKESVEAVCGGDTATKAIDARQLSARGGAMTVTVKDGRALLVGKGWRTSYGTLESFE